MPRIEGHEGGQIPDNSSSLSAYYENIAKAYRQAAREELTRRILDLRSQGNLTYPQIAEELGIPKHLLSNILTKQIKEGKTEPLPRKAKRKLFKGGKKQNSPHRMETILDEHLRDHPNQPIDLSEVAKTLGILKESARQRYKKIALNKEVPPTKRPLSPEILDPQVKSLSDQGLDVKKIAKELKVRMGDVKDAVKRNKRLLAEEFDKVCLKLRTEGYNDKEIAKITGKERGAVNSAFRRLEKKGEKVRLRKKRATKKELEERDTLVLDLRKRGFKAQEIAVKLDLNISAVGYTITRARRLSGEIRTSNRKRRKNLTKEQIATLDQEMTQLFNQGLSYMEVESRFEVSHSTFYRRFDYLRSQGLLPAPYDKKTHS